MSINLDQIESSSLAGKNAGKKDANAEKWYEKDIQLFGSGLGDRKKEAFYSELSVLFSAGVDIKSALELVEEEQRKDRDKKLFQAIGQSVMSGEDRQSVV